MPSTRQEAAAAWRSGGALFKQPELLLATAFFVPSCIADTQGTMVAAHALRTPCTTASPTAFIHPMTVSPMGARQLAHHTPAA